MDPTTDPTPAGEVVPADLLNGTGDYAGLPLADRARLAGFRPDGPDTASAAGGSELVRMVERHGLLLFSSGATMMINKVEANRIAGEAADLFTRIEAAIASTSVPALDRATAAAAGHAYATRHERANAGDAARYGAVIVTQAGTNRTGTPRWWLRNTVEQIEEAAGRRFDSKTFYLALLGELEAGRIEQTRPTLYRATGREVGQ